MEEFTYCTDFRTGYVVSPTLPATRTIQVSNRSPSPPISSSRHGPLTPFHQTDTITLQSSSSHGKPGHTGRCKELLNCASYSHSHGFFWCVEGASNSPAVRRGVPSLCPITACFSNGTWVELVLDWKRRPRPIPVLTFVCQVFLHFTLIHWTGPFLDLVCKRVDPPIGEDYRRGLNKRVWI